MLRSKRAPQIRNGAAHLHERHAMLSANRVQHVCFDHVHERQLPRLFLRRQHNRRKKTLPSLHRIGPAHRPRPQRGHRQIQIMRPLRQRKRWQKPRILPVEVICSSRCHQFHRFLPNTTTKPFSRARALPIVGARPIRLRVLRHLNALIASSDSIEACLFVDKCGTYLVLILG
jgi:hypothetical protein